MKNIILTGILLLYTTLSFAQRNRNRAEVFLQINDAGAYTVYLDNEFVGSENGRFRFYDVYNSNPSISIYKNNNVVFKKNINVVQDQRLVLTYSKNVGLSITKQLNIYRNVEYALDDFDNYNDNKQPTSNYVDPRTISATAFQQLNQMVKNEAFDEKKTNLIIASTKNSLLTTEQATVLLKQYSFDSKMISAAKALYKNVIDPQNYFTVANLFTFSSYKDEFLTFINNSQ